MRQEILLPPEKYVVFLPYLNAQTFSHFIIIVGMLFFHDNKPVYRLQQQAHGRPLIAIYRRLVLSSYFYLLLLFVGQNRASKSLIHITPRVLRFLLFSTNKIFEGQLKPSKPVSYRSFSWLTLLFHTPPLFQ